MRACNSGHQPVHMVFLSQVSEFLTGIFLSSVFFISVLIVLVSGPVFGADLTVEKMIKEQDVTEGGSVTVQYLINNPYAKDLQIRIVDKSILGNNGMDIQCLDYVLPAAPQAILEAEPIEPFVEGTYELNPVSITYTDPETGEQKTAMSNKLNVTVHDSNISAAASGITTLYQCGGQSIKSTSYSSSGQQNQPNQQNQNSREQQSGTESQQGQSSSQQEMDEKMQQMQDQLGQKQQEMEQQMQEMFQQKMQNSQMQQDTAALKKQMQEQFRQQQEMEQAFKENVLGNEQMQKMGQSLASQGFEMSSESFSPQAYDTGEFQMMYQDADGTAVMVSGMMQNGTMKRLEQENMEQKDMDRFDPEMDWKEHEDKRRKMWYAVFFFVLALFGLMLLAKHLSVKKDDTNSAQIPIAECVFDHKKEALRMLDIAKVLFKEKQEKDAYQKVSEAVRLFLSHEHGLMKEVTAAEIVSYLKKKKMAYSDVRKCLDLCAMVEFAKHRASDRDFAQMISFAERIISG